MRRIILIAVLSLIVIASCRNTENKTTFSPEALKAIAYDNQGNPTTIEEILAKTKGQTTFVDLWAAWCGDCLKGMPKVQALQEKYGDKIAYTFLSLDRKESKWKMAISKYGLKGNHYWFRDLENWKTHPFTKDIDLDWIPRYMVIGKDGTIKLFRAIEADDVKLFEAIDQDLN